MLSIFLHVSLLKLYNYYAEKLLNSCLGGGGGGGSTRNGFLFQASGIRHCIAPCKGIQDSLGFRIPIVSGIPDSLSCIPDSISKIFPDSGIRILLNGAKWYGFYQRKYIKG